MKRIIKFEEEYSNVYKMKPNQLSFLSYDIVGLVYFLIYNNDFILDKKIFYQKNKFKGKIGIFEINKNVITINLLYSVNDEKFIKSSNFFKSFISVINLILFLDSFLQSFSFSFWNKIGSYPNPFFPFLIFEIEQYS